MAQLAVVMCDNYEIDVENEQHFFSRSLQIAKLCHLLLAQQIHLNMTEVYGDDAHLHSSQFSCRDVVSVK